MDDPTAQQSIKGYSARLDGDPMDLLAIGDDAVISKRIEEFLAAGCSKFVLIPIADGADDVMAQTEQLAEAVLPRFEGLSTPTPRRPVPAAISGSDDSMAAKSLMPISLNLASPARNSVVPHQGQIARTIGGPLGLTWLDKR